MPGILGAGDGGEQDTPPSVCPDCRVVRPARGRGDRARWSAACPGSGRRMPGQRLKMQSQPSRAFCSSKPHGTAIRAVCSHTCPSDLCNGGVVFAPREQSPGRGRGVAVGLGTARGDLARLRVAAVFRSKVLSACLPGVRRNLLLRGEEGERGGEAPGIPPEAFRSRSALLTVGNPLSASLVPTHEVPVARPSPTVATSSVSGPCQVSPH